MTTMAVGEEGDTTMAVGEEGQQPEKTDEDS
jgi:hypothetical protein